LSNEEITAFTCCWCICSPSDARARACVCVCVCVCVFSAPPCCVLRCVSCSWMIDANEKCNRMLQYNIRNPVFVINNFM
jgi:hypothetical protein